MCFFCFSFYEKMNYGVRFRHSQIKSITASFKKEANLVILRQWLLKKYEETSSFFLSNQISNVFIKKYLYLCFCVLLNAENRLEKRRSRPLTLFFENICLHLPTYYVFLFAFYRSLTFDNCFGKKDAKVSLPIFLKVDHVIASYRRGLWNSGKTMTSMVALWLKTLASSGEVITK